MHGAQNSLKRCIVGHYRNSREILLSCMRVLHECSAFMHVFLMYVPAARSHLSLSLSQVNNATARVMTNKKVVNPYTNSKSASLLMNVLSITWRSLTDVVESQWDLLQSDIPLSVPCFCRLETQSRRRSRLRAGALRRWGRPLDNIALFCCLALLFTLKSVWGAEAFAFFFLPEENIIS